MFTQKKFKLQSKVSLPTTAGKFELAAYSTEKDDKMPHLALISQKTNSTSEEVVNVRIHSECITGDLFGSLRCDCGDQLDKSLNYINRNGGILIYLRQEGRGIGIINKIKAYVEQDKGFDTAEANKRLGFGFDDRKYEDAIEMLVDLGVTKINLLTNNPSKIEAFENGRVELVSRTPLEISPNDENIKYLKTKKDFFGHLLKSV